LFHIYKTQQEPDPSGSGSCFLLPVDGAPVATAKKETANKDGFALLKIVSLKGFLQHFSKICQGNGEFRRPYGVGPQGVLLIVKHQGILCYVKAVKVKITV